MKRNAALRKNILFSVLAITMALLYPINAYAYGEGRFSQDRFAIGLWVNPPLDEHARTRYREIAEANFTMVIGGFGGSTSKRLVALCRRNNLKLILSAGTGDIASLPDSSAVWGYSLRDEPSAAQFPELRERSDSVRLEHPGKLAFINLFPDYASAEQLGTETYDEHVRRFMEIVEPDVLSMDHYPRFTPDRDGRDAYCGNLAVMRKYALQAHIPFWNFFNIMPYGPHTDPTEAQVHWQIYTSLAYGAKGIMYFCYYTPGGGIFPKGGAIIARDGRKTRHYGEAQRINAEIQHLGPTLMQLTSQAVIRISEEAGDVPSERLAGTPILDLKRAKEDPPQEYLVGVFTHTDGRRAVLLNNYRFAYTAWPTVLFDRPTREIMEVDPHSGKERPVVDDSPNMDGLQISLGAGRGRLFLLPPK
jgi:hypothetical protein